MATDAKAMDANFFVFQSDKAESLFGFAGTPAGDSLPKKFAPWTGIGVVRPDQVPPNNLPRAAIEAGIAENGYQLWRKKKASAS